MYTKLDGESSYGFKNVETCIPTPLIDVEKGVKNCRFKARATVSIKWKKIKEDFR